MFSPSFSSYRKFKESYEKLHTDHFGDDLNFGNIYDKLQGKIFILSERSKIFIVENYEKIEDWSKLNIYLTDNKPILNDKKLPNYGTVHFYSKSKPNISKTKSKILQKMRLDRYENQKPIESITNVVLDETDGDFSLTINGQQFWWLGDENVIEIASFIYENIKSDG